MAYVQPQESQRVKDVLPFWQTPLEGLCRDSDADIYEWFKLSTHYRFPISREDPAQKFYSLAATWRHETAPMSSTTEMAMHPAYQQIIGMGLTVIPFVLRELEIRPDHWAWALKAITGIDPVQPLERGRVKQMAEAWLRWGREQGYRW
jgi:hypothetical protein